jgi:hypothetical protein
VIVSDFHHVVAWPRPIEHNISFQFHCQCPRNRYIDESGNTDRLIGFTAFKAEQRRSRVTYDAITFSSTQKSIDKQKSFFTFDLPLKGMTKVRRIESTSRISPVAATPHRNQLPEERQSAGNTEKQIVCWLLEFSAAQNVPFFSK